VIIAVSTSSPLASAAVFQPDGTLVNSLEEIAPRTASNVLMRIRDHVDLSKVTGVVADAGPGSFTGVKVGITFAKSLAFALSVKCGAIGAQFLVEANGKVVLPSRRGQYFIFEGERWENVTELTVEAPGYGPDFAEPTYPHAMRLGEVWDKILWQDPMTMVPDYKLNPSISAPKQEILKRVIGK